MIRVLDLDRSLDFYIRLMQMQLLRKTMYQEGRFTNAFVGYGPVERAAVLELTLNWDRTDPYEKGNAWGHLAIEVGDLAGFVAGLRSADVPIIREPGPMKGSPYSIAFIRDPDDYPIELLQWVPNKQGV